MVHLSVFSLLVANEVKERDKRFAAQLVNELALPEKHDVLLHFYRFFLQGVLMTQISTYAKTAR
jgi:hypothetical protein